MEENRRIRLRPLALPAEHGGWALLFEPIALGLLVAPSLVGVLISVAASGAFLARHPFKLAVVDWRRGRWVRRSGLAGRFAILYLVLMTLALALAIKFGGSALLLPLILAAPMLLIQLSYDSLGRSRALVAELAGSIAPGAVATAIAIAGNWPIAESYGLWVVLAARAAPTILYLRARLRLLHHKPASPLPAIIAHVLATIIAVSLALGSIVPYPAIVAISILLLRAVIGFSESDKQITAKRLGLREVAFGALTVFVLAIGYSMTDMR